MDALQKIAKWYISLIASVLFTICAYIYFNAIEGLKKPAGIVEALKFLVESPKEYSLCLLCGGIAKITFGVTIIVAIASIMCLAKMLYNSKYNYEEIALIDIVGHIVNCILAIAIGIVQAKIILNFWI